MSNTINVHAKFSGVVAETIDAIIKSGRAASRTEAIRLAVMDYHDHHISKEEELDRLAVAKMERIDAEIASGKRKVLTAKEAMGEKWGKMLEE
jgi:Arc/MetJ-type ribon-helix-helix transcriptional regulator